MVEARSSNVAVSLLEQKLGEDLAPLLRLLTRAEGFALVLLQCNVPVERDQLINELIAELEQKGRGGRVLKLEKEVVDLRAELAATVPPSTADAVLFVLGLERSIPSERSAPVLNQLNMSRELFRDFHFPLVLVLPEYALTRLAREALDFWAWRSGVFEVSLSTDRLSELHQEPLDDQEDSSENLSAERKWARLEVLRELLSEYDNSENTYEEERARLLVEIGLLSWSLGEWRQARDAASQALAIAEKRGDAALRARALHALGLLEQARGDHEMAIANYQEALEIREHIGDVAGIASSYHQLGNALALRGDYEQALDWYQKSLLLNEQVGNRAGVASCYRRLGIVAQHRSDYDQALHCYQKSLQITKELGGRAGMASSYHRLGTVAQERGDYEQALDCYKKALKINEDLGRRASMASSYGRIGALFTLRREALEAVPISLRSLAIYLKLQSPEIRVPLYWLCRQREQLGDGRFRAILAEHLDADSLAETLEMIEQAAPTGLT